MKYQIRTQAGHELDVADGGHVVMLFRQKFLEPDDEIRRVGSEKWRKLRDIPEYAQMMRSEANDVTRFRMVFLVTALLACLGIVLAVFLR
jgi:hypothetical protein